MSAVAALFRRELSLAWGRGGGPLLSGAFFACVATLLPFAVGSEPDRLASVAPGAAWLALALTSLLSLERLFERDLDDGALELLATGPLPLEIVAAVKCGAQWLAGGAPLAVLAPMIAAALGADLKLAPLTFVAALLGGLSYAFVGGVGAALALGARRGGLLIAVMVLPLFAPPVIFGGGALAAAATDLDPLPGLLLLAGYGLFAVALGPFAMAAAVRSALD